MCVCMFIFFFFFKQKTAYEMRISDWSSDVCLPISKFADRCRSCELDFTRFNVGDGPAAFLTMIVGAVIVGLALWLDFSVHPPFWVHALIWIPVTTGAVLLGLRISKAALLASEYSHHAREAGGRQLVREDVEQG